MPRIRTIKPDAFLSESLSSVPRGTRWTFAGLWTFADDAGRARDDVRLIKAALYPLDDDVSLEDVREDLSLLAGIGGICRYVVDGRNYLHMPRWEHQKINRPTPAKSPPCPTHEDGMSGHVITDEDSLNPHGVISEPSVGEGKGREKDREGNAASKKRASRLPAEWVPTDEHRKRCAKDGIDVELQADKFRAHADANDRRQVNWNASFTTWLLNAKEWGGSNVRQFPQRQDAAPYVPTFAEREAAGPPPNDPEDFRAWHKRLHTHPDHRDGA